MEKLDIKQAIAYENYYQALLVGKRANGKRINHVIKQNHEEDNSKYKVVVCIETEKLGNDWLPDLDSFCKEFHYPYPPIE